MKLSVAKSLIFGVIILLVIHTHPSYAAEDSLITPDPLPPVNAPSGYGTSAPGLLKIMTFNIHHGTDVNGMFNLEAVVETIRQSGADIIALQEVDRIWGGRSLYYDEASFIAGQLSMEYAFGATLTQNPFHPGSGEYGIMILSKFPILNSSFRLLPGIMEQRGILLCLIQTPEYVIPVACAHLGLSTIDWEIQITDILNWLPLVDDVLLLGDFNAVIGTYDLPRFAGRLIDLQRECGLSASGTFLLGANLVRIDYIFAGNRWHPSNCRIIPGDSSDHLPVYVEITPVMNE